MVIYLLKFSACLAVLMTVYTLLLERESFHRLKRFYLLASILFALSIPLITFTTYVEPIPAETVAFTETTIPFENVQQTEILETNYLSIILWSLYGIGVFLFGLKFMYNLTSIFRKIKQNPKHASKSFIHVLLSDLVAPHTFFSYIFLNKQKFESNDIPEEVYIHEQAHAKQKHSLDILFVELLQIVFWFNPLIYLTKKAIKLNHEFLADKAVLKNGISTANYQQTLLAYSSHASEPQLANAINYSSIKKRFTVMKTHTSKTKTWLKSIVLLPLLAILVYSFSSTKQVEKNIYSETSVANHTARSISIDVFDNGTYKIDGIKATKKTFVSVINQLHQDITPEIRNQIINVHVNNGKAVSDKEVWFIYDSFMDYGFHRIVTYNQEIIREKGNKPYAITNTHTQEHSNVITKKADKQKGASKAQITEYNKIAKHYNSQKGSNYTIKLSDMKRIKYLYDLMTEEQKRQAEPFPSFPPPPPPPPAPGSVSADEKASHDNITKKAKDGKAYSYTYKDKHGKTIEVNVDERDTSVPPPPPPPIPANATPEKKAPYKKAHDAYYKKYKIKNGKVEHVQAPEPPAPPKTMTVGKKTNQAYYDSLASFKYKGGLSKTESDEAGVDAPPPPPPPMNPLDFVINMAKKDATFYYEDKKIRSDEAIKIMKSNKSMNISTKNADSKNPKVYLSKEPITIKNK